MRRLVAASALMLAIGPVASAQAADDWQPLVGMCESYAANNPPPHASGPASPEWVAACVVRNYFPHANALAIGSCVATAYHMTPAVAKNPDLGIPVAVHCLQSNGNIPQHGWK